MNPSLDHIAVAVIVLGALVYFAKRFFPRRSGKSCDAGCGCSASQPKIKLPR